MHRLVLVLMILPALLALHQAALAAAIYDASIALSVSQGPNAPGIGGLLLFPGVTFTPPPLIEGTATATNSADAHVPGQIRAAASGQTISGGLTAVSSTATAIGFGLYVVGIAGSGGLVPPSFPLDVTEEWSLFVSASDRAQASVNFQLLLDGVSILSDRRSVSSGFAPRSDTGSATFHLAVPVTTGSHVLLFQAEALGLGAVPEPSTILLFGSALVGVAAVQWRRRRRK